MNNIQNINNRKKKKYKQKQVHSWDRSCIPSKFQYLFYTISLWVFVFCPLIVANTSPLKLQTFFEMYFLTAFLIIPDYISSNLPWSRRHWILVVSFYMIFCLSLLLQNLTNIARGFLLSKTSQGDVCCPFFCRPTRKHDSVFFVKLILTFNVLLNKFWNDSSVLSPSQSSIPKIRMQFFLRFWSSHSILPLNCSFCCCRKVVFFL